MTRIDLLHTIVAATLVVVYSLRGLGMAWYYQRGGVETGPVSSAELKEAANLGRIDAETQVRRDMDEGWFPASKVRGLEFGVLPAPPLPMSLDSESDGSIDVQIRPVPRTPKPIEKRLAAAGDAIGRGMRSLVARPAQEPPRPDPAVTRPALIACPACSHQMSVHAAACPGCGHPGPLVSPPGGTHSGAPMLTELTAKKYKAMQIVGVGVGVVGMIVTVSSFATESVPMSLFSASICCTGIAIYLVARTLAWWHHG